jgi:hypothetical protein
MGSIDAATMVTLIYQEGGKGGVTISVTCQLAELDLSYAEIATLATEETWRLRAKLREALRQSDKHEQD